MKKPTPKHSHPVAAKTGTTPINVVYLIIILAYTFVTPLTPYLQALDKNGPKFLFLSALNLIAFILICTQKRTRSHPELPGAFFSNKIGIAYSGFLLMMLVSFTKAFNIPEAILMFTKVFTVFSTVFNVYLLLSLEKRLFRILCAAMAILLLYESFAVFYNIALYISGQIKSIFEIKSNYSNKNILSAGIFVKIPFALWLATFEKSWLKRLGYFTLFCAVLAVLFMSTRAFYLGLIVLAIVFSFYLFRESKSQMAMKPLKIVGVFVGVILVAFVLFTVTQKYLFPKNKDAYNTSFTNRLSTAVTGETSSSLRLQSWSWSAKMFKENPLLGIGTGNWKPLSLKYENPMRPDFSYMIKNHNDFIEMTVETGIFGGLAYLGVFIFIMFNFLRAYLRKGADKESYVYLFLPAFGIMCYSFDAFFNLPIDRPTIQNIFAVYVGAGIAFSSPLNKESKAGKSWVLTLSSGIFILLMSGAIYIHSLNLKSLQLQSIVYNDLKAGKLEHPSSMFTQGFPYLPDLAVEGEPTAVSKARYLINEGNNQEAVNVLRQYTGSPWDARREIFMAMAFTNMKQDDSALLYTEKAHLLKPLHFNTLGSLCNMFERKNNKAEAMKRLDEYVASYKGSKDAWIYLAYIHKTSGDLKGAIATLDTAIKYLPADTAIQADLKKFKKEAMETPFSKDYDQAKSFFDQKRYLEARNILDRIMAKENRIGTVCTLRAICSYYMKDYNTAIKDIDHCAAVNEANSKMINLRGICYHQLGNFEAACKDFKESAAQGNEDGVTNVQRFCQGK